MGKRWPSLMLLVLMLSSCVKVTTYTDYEPDHSRSYQTTLHYFIGTSLKSYFLNNISDARTAVEAGALGDNGSYFYCMPQSSSEAVLYELVLIEGECYDVERKRYTNFASAEQESIELVLSDMKSITGYSESSSRSLNLILGSHGLGWLLKPSSSYGAVDMMAQDVDGVVSSGSEGSIIADYEAIPDHLRMSRYMGVSSDGYTDIEELREAIDNSGIKFGYIIFDQCYMGSIELLYRLRDCCYYAVASPAEIMSTGFPYDTVLPALFENNGRDYNLQGVCEAYYEYYLTTNETLNCGCIAMCDMGELEALAEVVSRMSLTTLFEEDDLMGYDNYSLHRFYDFGDYIRSAGGDETSLLEEFNNQFDRAFPEECRLHTDKYFVSVNGIATPTIDAAAYSGVTTSDLARGLTDCVGWELEPWSIAAGRVDN